MNAYRECVDRIPAAFREAVEILDYTGTTSVGEVADCTADQLGEFSCYLAPRELDDLYAAVTRYVLDAAGLDRYASDATPLVWTELAGLVRIAR